MQPLREKLRYWAMILEKNEDSAMRALSHDMYTWYNNYDTYVGVVSDRELKEIVFDKLAADFYQPIKKGSNVIKINLN